jgi:hypothetical protein
MTAPVSKGDRYLFGAQPSVVVTVTRVARDESWADIRCTVPGSTWTKRQPLPLSATFRRVEGGAR